MKKGFISVFMLVFMLITLCGCGSRELEVFRANEYNKFEKNLEFVLEPVDEKASRIVLDDIDEDRILYHEVYVEHNAEEEDISVNQYYVYHISDKEKVAVGGKYSEPIWVGLLEQGSVIFWQRDLLDTNVCDVFIMDEKGNIVAPISA